MKNKFALIFVFLGLAVAMFAWRMDFREPFADEWRLRTGKILRSEVVDDPSDAAAELKFVSVEFEFETEGQRTSGTIESDTCYTVECVNFSQEKYKVGNPVEIYFRIDNGKIETRADSPSDAGIKILFFIAAGILMLLGLATAAGLTGPPPLARKGEISKGKSETPKT